MNSNATEGGRLTATVITAAIALASALFVMGLVLFLMRGGAEHPFQVHSLFDLVRHACGGIVQGRPRAFIEAGLIVLLLAPFLRLAAGVVQSMRSRDWRFVVIGLVVATLLLTGIVLGTGG